MFFAFTSSSNWWQLFVMKAAIMVIWRNFYRNWRCNQVWEYLGQNDKWILLHGNCPFMDILWSFLIFCITWNLFREINHIVNSLLKKLFSQKFFKKLWYKNFVKSTVWRREWKLLKFTPTVKVKTLLSRNFCQKSVTVNFHNFHTVCQGISICKIFVNLFQSIFTFV